MLRAEARPSPSVAGCSRRVPRALDFDRELDDLPGQRGAARRPTFRAHRPGDRPDAHHPVPEGPGAMSALEIRDLAVEVAGRPLLEGLTLSLRAGDKVGVVGRNGAGKTSLLKVLAGERQPTAGRVVVRGRLGYLRQDPRQHRAEDE